MQLNLNVMNVSGLPEPERETLDRLVKTLNRHAGKNAEKRRYYEGHVRLADVNLGLALPKGVAGLEIGCSWGEKCVDVLAAHSMFDGFVGSSGEEAAVMTKITEKNDLIAEYMKACRDELKYGCTFATLSADEDLGCRIRFHSPETAAAEWNGEKGRIGAGLVIAATEEDAATGEQTPCLAHLHTDDAMWELRRGRTGADWTAKRHPNAMGRPLMEPFIWNATSAKPFGRSRLKEPIRRLIQGYVRTVCNATIGLEFATAPQKYLLGVSEDQYDSVISQSFRMYVGSLMSSTTNPETGEKPTFGQLPQGTIEPHVAQIRILATQFAAATGLTVSDVGVINDANPSSADAILAQNRTMVLMAEQLNASNGNSLRTVALMAQAIARNTTLDQLTDEERDVMAHFKNPAMPSVAATADAAVKLATARPGFGETDVFLEMSGFSQADIRRIKAQESRARGLKLLTEEPDNADLEE